MKQILVLLTAFIAMLSLSSCGGNNPSDVAMKSYKCIENDDMNGFAKLVYIPEEKIEDKEKFDKEFWPTIFPMLTAQVKEHQGLKSYAVESEEVQAAAEGKPETAVVKMKVEYNDGKTQDSELKLINVDGKWKIDMGK